jgi:ribosomal protein S18 acetylase RimI-like enzyme
VDDRGIDIMMVRDTLDGVPQHAPPEDYRLRLWEPGDGATWTRIWTAASRFGEITPETFRREFGADDDLLRERQFFLCDARGRAVGTATAWRVKPEDEPTRGLVHWVAVVPELQGRGLAKALMTAVCNRLRGLGYRGAQLITQEARVAAVGLYLAFGFRPHARSDEERRAWVGLREKMSPSALDRLDSEP